MTRPDPLPQTELLSPEEKQIYKVGYLDALSEAAEIAAGKQNFEVDHPCKGAWNGCAQGIRSSILSRVKEIES